MLWNEFVKLDYISKLPLNEQVRKFSEFTLDEENLYHSSKNVGASLASVNITIAPLGQLGIVRLYVNNTLSLTQTNFGSKSILLNLSNTFFIVLEGVNEDFARYTLTNNGVVVISEETDSFSLTSPTFTASPGGNYVFTCDGYNA
jgi:hypothetical protein